ncbi:MAG TPA: pyrimidine reductase family protein [Mycobacterium sp.]|nr:pyrimidine reductase family protein [Mycobacterium sp.]HZA09099.1 pyrimidine reductase family protein [Mycobacterium sp.]
MKPVSDDDAATQFTVLGVATAVDTAGLADLYAYPAGLNGCWVRANMIASLDGGATVDGRAGGLGGAGDRALFKVMREVADVVLVGAGTVRAENYSGAVLTVAGRQRRQRRGQGEIPPIAVVTGSGALEPDSKLFTHTEAPPLIFTTTVSFEATRDRLQGRAEVIDASTSDPIAVDTAAVVAELGRRGLYRVLCEGGPTLLGDIIGHGLLDELGLTIAPILVAGGAPRVAGGRAAVTANLRAVHILTDAEGYLYTLFGRDA